MFFKFLIFAEEQNDPPVPALPTTKPPTLADKPKTAPKPVRTRTDPIRPARRSDTVPIKPRAPSRVESAKPGPRRIEPSTASSRAPVRPKETAARVAGKVAGRTTRPGATASKPPVKDKPSGLVTRKGSWHDHISPYSREEEVAAGGQFEDVVGPLGLALVGMLKTN